MKTIIITLALVACGKGHMSIPSSPDALEMPTKLTPVEVYSKYDSLYIIAGQSNVIDPVAQTSHAGADLRLWEAYPAVTLNAKISYAHTDPLPWLNIDTEPLQSFNGTAMGPELTFGREI